MILKISSGTEEVAVEITSQAGTRKIRLGGINTDCDCLRLADGHYSLILNGSVHDVLVDIDSDTCIVTSRAGTHTFRITDPRRSGSGSQTHEGPPGLQRVCADMPGKVVRVLVQEADVVANDQGLLVLEAMKMQNEIRAPKSGVVKEVAAIAGTTVNTGDFLLSIES